MSADEVGGAVVTRAFSLNGVRVERNRKLTREEVLAIPTRNREALVSSGQIREFPRSIAVAPEPGERFIVRRPDLKFDVVEGYKVNAEPLTKAEAELLRDSVMTERPRPQTTVNTEPQEVSL
jgi:hypothetical protein